MVVFTSAHEESESYKQTILQILESSSEMVGKGHFEISLINGPGSP